MPGGGSEAPSDIESLGPRAGPKGGKAYPRLKRDCKSRIGVLIQIQQAGLRVVAGGEQLLRGPRHDGGLAAYDQRGYRPDAKGAAAAQIHLSVRRQRDQGTIEPAGINRAGPGDPALENVLTIEMRALSIWRRRGVHDGSLLCIVHSVQVRHRGIEREKCIQRQRGCLAVEHQGPISAQADPVGVADRCDRTQSIERAPQHDDEHARIAARRPRKPGHLAPCKQSTGAEQRFATAGQVVAKGHGHLLWNSADMNNSTSACWRVSARPTACITSGETEDPSTVSMTSWGSVRLDTRSAKLLATSSRRPMPSIQDASSSG